MFPLVSSWHRYSDALSVRSENPRIFGADYLVRPAALLFEAIVAIYRSVTSGQERNFGVLAALSADYRMHLPPHPATKPTAAAVISSTGPSGLSASGAPLGFVGVAFVRVVLLVVSSENEGLVALHARQVSILKSHR